MGITALRALSTERLSLLLGLAVLAAAAGCQRQGTVEAGPAARVVSASDGTEIRLLAGAPGLLAEIMSDRGIGRASLAFAATALPETVALRLHLNGLERLEIDNGALRLQIAIATSPPHVLIQELLDERGTQLLEAGDALWAAVTMVSVDGSAPAIPLQNGYIDVTLPNGLIDAGHSVLQVAWVDFYR